MRAAIVHLTPRKTRSGGPTCTTIPLASMVWDGSVEVD